MKQSKLEDAVYSTLSFDMKQYVNTRARCSVVV